MHFKNYRWLIVAMLFFATTINYLDRQIIGLLKPTLEREFNWTETAFAHIVMAFTAAYAIGLLSFGWLIDRIGTKAGYAWSVIIWSISGMCHALARSVTGFSLARVGLGIGEAGNFPAAMKAVAAANCARGWLAANGSASDRAIRAACTKSCAAPTGGWCISWSAAMTATSPP